MARDIDNKAPDAFRTISEVAEALDVPQHVLRFWEGKFPQIKPMKRAGGRRLYRPEDVALLTGIRVLLYGRGYKIRGVQQILKEKGVRHVMDIGGSELAAAGTPIAVPGTGEGGQGVEAPPVSATTPAAAQPNVVPLDAALDAAGITLPDDKRQALQAALDALLEARALLAGPGKD